MTIQTTWKVAFLLLFLASVLPLVPLTNADHAVRENIPVIWPNSRPFFAGMTYGSFCSPRNNTADITRTFNLCRRVGADVRWSYCWTSQSQDWRGANVPPFNNPGPASAQNRLIRGRAYACSDAINLADIVIAENADHTVTITWDTGINADSLVEMSLRERPLDITMKDMAEVRRHSLTTEEPLLPGVYDVEITSTSRVTGRSQSVSTSFVYTGDVSPFIEVEITAPDDGVSFEYDPSHVLSITALVSGTERMYSTDLYADGIFVTTRTCPRGTGCIFTTAMPVPTGMPNTFLVRATSGELTDSDDISITITKRTPTVVWNGPENAVYGTETITSCSGRDSVLGELPATLLIEGREADNPDVERLGAGTYTYTCNVPETLVTAAVSATRSLTVNRATPFTRLFLNGVEADATVRVGDSLNLRGELHLLGMDSDRVSLLADFDEVASDFLVASGVYTFRDDGVHTASAVYLGNQNYTPTSISRIVNVNPAPGAPVITLSTPPTPLNGATVEDSFPVVITSSKDLASATLEVTNIMSGESTSIPMTRLNPRSFSVTATLSFATFDYHATAIDTDGLTGISETRRVAVVPGVPVITFIPPTPSDNSYTLLEPFTLAIQSDRDLSSATAYFYDAEMRETRIALTSIGPREYRSVINLAPGDYTYYVHAVSLEGRTSDSAPRAIHVTPVTIATTFTSEIDHAFGGLVNYQRAIGVPPFEPPALFAGTRAAPMVYGGAIYRSYDGVNWETVHLVNYVYFRGVDRTPIEGVCSMYANPLGRIYFGTCGWRHPVNGPAQATVFYSQDGGAMWGRPWEVVIPYQNRITAINRLFDHLEWGTSGTIPPSQSRAFWACDPLEDNPCYGSSDALDSGVVKITGLTSPSGDFYSFYFAESGSVYRGVGYPLGSEINTPVGDFGNRIDDAITFNGRVYIAGVVAGVLAIYSTTDGVTFTLVHNFDESVTSIKGFYNATNGKLYFGTSYTDSSAVWSITPAGVVTQEFRVPGVDEINYISELGNYLYIAGKDESVLTVYKDNVPLA